MQKTAETEPQQPFDTFKLINRTASVKINSQLRAEGTEHMAFNTIIRNRLTVY